jgi:uncharacterized membrane protein
LSGKGWRIRASLLLEAVQSRFWLLPSIIALLLMALMPLIRRVSLPEASFISRLLLYEGASDEGGRHLLTSVATATMTVVGVLFSVTILVLQQVSTQFTPRMIENFIRSTTSQTVLGFFVGTFGFSLLALRSVGVEGEAGVVPTHHLNVTVAIILAMTCLALLIYFVHHIAKSIESSFILASIRKKTVKVLREIEGSLFEEGQRPVGIDSSSYTLFARESGYVQEISWSKLPELLMRGPWRAEILVAPGDFIYPGMPLLRLDSEFPNPKELLGLFEFGTHRTQSEDPHYGIKQLSDVALRALSPSTHDPSTAIEAIQEIGLVLYHFTHCCRHSKLMKFPGGALLQLKNDDFSTFVNNCFDQVMLAGKDFSGVLVAIRTALEESARAGEASRRRVLKMKIRQVNELLRKLEAAQLESLKRSA